MAVSNPSWHGEITGSELPTAVEVLHGQLQGFSPSLQLRLQMSLAPCSVFSSLYYIICPSNFPSTFSTVAPISPEDMEKARQWVATQVTPGDFSDPFGPADVHKAFAR